MNIQQIIKKLDLKPLEIEGGFFCRTYTSDVTFGEANHSIGSAIYYLITPDSFSSMHMLKSSDEMFHFYYGDPVEMLMLNENGEGEIVTISNHSGESFYPQHLVPKGVWQGTRLKSGGKFALLGVTVTPAFEYDDFIVGQRDFLLAEFPLFKKTIKELTR